MDGQTKISRATSSEIIKPKGKDVTVWRNNAPDGQGIYYGKQPNTGYNEPIGGPGMVVGGNAMAFRIIQSGNQSLGTRLSVSDLVFGTAPIAYTWSIASSRRNPPLPILTPPGAVLIVDPVIASGQGTPGIVLQEPGPSEMSMGLIECKAVDATGKVAYAQYWVVGQGAPV